METPTEEKMDPTVFDKITGAIGWLQIVASPLLIGIGIAAGLYALFPHRITSFISIAIVVLAFVIGIIWATKIARKRGTINFMSRYSSTEIIKSKEEK